MMWRGHILKLFIYFKTLLLATTFTHVLTSVVDNEKYTIASQAASLFRDWITGKFVSPVTMWKKKKKNCKMAAWKSPMDLEQKENLMEEFSSHLNFESFVTCKVPCPHLDFSA